MTNLQVSRRTIIKAAGAASALGAIGAPAILRAADTVKVGFLAPLTGQEAILGETQLRCFQLAIDEINASGGAGGRQLVPIIEDDETSAKASIDKTRKLCAQDNVDVVIGLLASLERKAAMTVTTKAKKLLIYPTYYEGGDCNKYLICSGQVPNQQINPMVPWIEANLGKTIYVLGHDYVWPRGSTEQLKKAGGQVIGSEFVPFGTQDFGPAFGRIKQAKPDVVWFMLVAGDAIAAVKQYRSFEMKQPLVFHGWDEATLGAVTPAEEAGIVASQGYFQRLDTPVNKAFTAAFAKKFGADKAINAIGESGYASTLLYAKAVAKAGSLDPEKVIPAMSQVEVEAPQGRLTIDARTNHARLGTIIARVTDKADFEIVKVTDPTDPDPGCTMR